MCSRCAKFFLPFLCSPEPIIRFSETKFSVSEPKEAGAVATVRIPLVRVGDTSKVSVVRVHTKDGSAISGEDYYPVSQGKHTHVLTRLSGLQVHHSSLLLHTGYLNL